MTGPSGGPDRDDGDHHDPLWLRVRQQVQADISSGALRAGSRIPSERVLSARLGVSRVTLRKALESLVDDGLLRAARSSGWYVVDRAPTGDWPSTIESIFEAARRVGLRVSADILGSGIRPATLDEGERLQVAAGTPLFFLERVRRLEGMPSAMDMTYLAAARVPGILEVDFEVSSMFDVLVEAGVEFVGARATIEAQVADEPIAARLEMPVGGAVLVLDQLGIDAAQRPVYSSRLWYRGDRNRVRAFFARSDAPGSPVVRRAVGGAPEAGSPAVTGGAPDRTDGDTRSA